MNKLLILLLVLSMLSGSVVAQDIDAPPEGLGLKSDYANVGKLDSVNEILIGRLSELRRAYDSTMNHASIKIDQYFAAIDSLQRKARATNPLASKLDSLTSLKNKALSDIKSKVEKLKLTVNESINKLNLPPELREKANMLTSRINKLDITKPNVLQEYLNVSVADLPRVNLPSVNLNNRLPDVPSTNVPLTNVGGQVQQYQNTLGRLPTNVDDAVKVVEENVKNVSAISDVQGELGRVSEVTRMTEKLQDQEALKKELFQEAQKQVVDHFADNKKQLNNAMQSISKYKSKFSTTTSLNDLPKKAPNEMKGKPLIERIVPGIAFQLQKKNDDLLVDFNLSLGYRFTKRFTSGAGWNQRIGYNTDKNAWSSGDARIYGPRLFCEYKVGKGFSPRVELEVMNTFVPPYLNKTKSDPVSREWVWGAFVGIKKDYTLYKKIKGTAMIMLRPFDPHRKSPYADVVNARFGFEIPIKRKTPTMRSN